MLTAYLDPPMTQWDTYRAARDTDVQGDRDRPNVERKNNEDQPDQQVTLSDDGVFSSPLELPSKSMAVPAEIVRYC